MTKRVQTDTTQQKGKGRSPQGGFDPRNRGGHCIGTQTFKEPNWAEREGRSLDAWEMKILGGCGREGYRLVGSGPLLLGALATEVS